AGDLAGAGDRDGPFEIVDAEVAHAPRADFSLLDEPFERANRVLEPDGTRPVKKIKVEVVGAEPPEALLARAQRSLERCIRRQDLRGEEDLLPTPTDRLGDDLLDLAAAVHLGRIDVGEPGIDPAGDRIDR